MPVIFTEAVIVARIILVGATYVIIMSGFQSMGRKKERLRTIVSHIGAKPCFLHILLGLFFTRIVINVSTFLTKKAKRRVRMNI